MEDLNRQLANMKIPAGLMTRHMVQQNDDSHFRVAGFSMGSMAPKADADYEVSYSGILVTSGSNSQSEKLIHPSGNGIDIL
jgi:hypothetical protein